MTAYRLYFLDDKNAIQAREEFSAESDTQAEAISAMLWQACSGSYPGYELWEARRRIVQGDAWSVLAGAQMCETSAADIQERVLALEERLLESHWRVSRSERLLASTQRLRDCLADKPAPVSHEDIVRYVCAATGSTMMSFQLVEEECLKLRGSCGFDRLFDEYFAVVDCDDCACGAAFRHACQTVVPAIQWSPIYAGQRSLEILRARGVVSCISTPLPEHNGAIAGMFSILRSEIWHPEDGELKQLNALAQQIAIARADPVSPEARLIRQR